MSMSKPSPPPPTEVGPNPFLSPGGANWKDVPAQPPAEAEADADADAEKRFVFPPDAAAYTYKGCSPADLALPSMDWSFGISKVLKQVHPDATLNLDALLVMEDLVTDLFSRLVAAAAKAKGSPTEVRCECGEKIIRERTIGGVTQYWVLNEDRECPVWVFAADLHSPAVVKAWESRSTADRAADLAEAVAELREQVSQDLAEMDEEPISSRDIQIAVRFLIPGQLAMHAVSEGTKAVTKYSASKGGLATATTGAKSGLSRKSGLQFQVELVGALMASVLGPGQLCRARSASTEVYLAAVMEYMSAEILELAGNAAYRDNRSGVITPRHIYLGISNDEELCAFYLGRGADQGHILGGGVTPNIHAVVLGRGGDESALTAMYSTDLEANDLVDADGAPDVGQLAQMLVGCTGRSMARGEGHEGEDWRQDMCHLAVLRDVQGWDDEHSRPQAAMATFVLAAATPTTAAVAAGAGAITTKDTAAPKAKKQGGARRHRKVLRDNIQGITREHIQLLAARAGITALSELCHEELRGVLKVFMEKSIRQMVNSVEHRRSRTVQLLDVLTAAKVHNSTLYGTGRLSDQLLRSIRVRSNAGGDSAKGAAEEEQALFEAEAVEARKEAAAFLHGDGEDGGLIAETAVAVRKEQDEKEAARRERDEGEAEAEDNLTPRERLLREDPPAETDPGKCQAYTLQLIRAMQTETKPVIPFLPFYRLTAEIGQDFKTDLVWAPELVCAFNAVVEHYLVGLLRDAHLNAIGRRMLAVEPKDIQLARRIRGERA